MKDNKNATVKRRQGKSTELWGVELLLLSRMEASVEGKGWRRCGRGFKVKRVGEGRRTKDRGTNVYFIPAVHLRSDCLTAWRSLAGRWLDWASRWQLRRSPICRVADDGLDSILFRSVGGDGWKYRWVCTGLGATSLCSVPPSVMARSVCSLTRSSEWQRSRSTV